MAPQCLEYRWACTFGKTANFFEKKKESLLLAMEEGFDIVMVKAAKNSIFKKTPVLFRQNV